MAGAEPPPEFGGGHEFLGDPNAVGLSTMVADMAAMNLQMLHTMLVATPEGPDGAAARATLEGFANRTRQVLAASRATHNRERATRELQPVSRVPAAAWGVAANIAGIRMHNVPNFSGTSADTLDVVRWIGRIMMLGEAHTLSFPATINLMIQGSSGGAADYIEQMRAEGKTLLQIVQQLEMRYGDLCTPQEARVKCNNLPRKEGEGLPEFIDRLRSMARMACRLEADAAIMQTQIDTLVEGNIRRVLPTSVRNALEERVINRSRMGLPAFTAREIEKECLDLERRRDERRDMAREVGVGKRHARVMKVDEDDSDVAAAVTSSSSEDELDVGDDGTYHLIREIKQVRQRYAQKGRPIDQAKVYRKAVRNFNERYPPKNPRGQPYGARQAMGFGPGYGNVAQPNVGQQRQPPGFSATPGGNNPRPNGPPNRLDTSVKRTIPDLLTMANVVRGQCIQCGFEGHYMHNEKCALKDKPLVDRPCAKCGQGLHSADDCPKVYQRDYVAPPQLQQGNQQQQQQANMVQSDEALNQ
jgi:hypothetical protein